MKMFYTASYGRRFLYLCYSNEQLIAQLFSDKEYLDTAGMTASEVSKKYPSIFLAARFFMIVFAVVSKASCLFVI